MLNVNVTMRARDQSSIYSTGGKFRTSIVVTRFTLVARSYALLVTLIGMTLLSQTFSMIWKRSPKSAAMIYAKAREGRTPSNDRAD